MNTVKCEVAKLVIPTYPEPKAEDLPVFSENRVHQRTSGNPYPNKVVLKVNRDEKIDKEYTVVVLENEYLKIEILPEIGGRTGRRCRFRPLCQPLSLYPPPRTRQRNRYNCRRRAYQSPYGPYFLQGCICCLCRI